MVNKKFWSQKKNFGSKKTNGKHRLCAKIRFLVRSFNVNFFLAPILILLIPKYLVKHMSLRCCFVLKNNNMRFPSNKYHRFFLTRDIEQKTLYFDIFRKKVKFRASEWIFKIVFCKNSFLFLPTQIIPSTRAVK